MPTLVPIAMFGWIPLVLAVFCFCRPRNAVLFALFGAWLFLPMAGYGFVGLPDYGKYNAGPLAAMLGVLLFDAGRLRQLRLSMWDLPMLVLLVSPMISAIMAGYGMYEGFSSIAGIAASSGLAYLLGRLYFFDAEGRRSLAMAFFVAGLVYVPFCLIEMRFSPQLHRTVYGFAQHEFAQTYRMGGWRPTVFMQHGLAVGLFMAAAAVIGVWLWMTKQLRTFAGLPMAFWALLLLGTAILCKSAFALAMLMVALPVLLIVRLTHWTVPVLLLALLPPAYMVGRITGVIESQQILTFVEPTVGEQIGSLSVRIRSEEILVPLAMQHPMWGAGRWSRLVEDSQGGRTDERDFGFLVVPDALWVITLANRGLVGLGALVLVFLVPVLALFRKGANGTSDSQRAFDPATALALVLVMHMTDNLLNAMAGPVFWLIASALTGMLARGTAPRSLQSQPSFIPSTSRAWN